jgi:hypothetical protein
LFYRGHPVAHLEPRLFHPHIRALRKGRLQHFMRRHISGSGTSMVLTLTLTLTLAIRRQRSGCASRKEKGNNKKH